MQALVKDTVLTQKEKKSKFASRRFAARLAHITTELATLEEMVA